MAITLPQDIQDLEIPPSMDARGGDLSARETFERAQKANFADRDAQQLFERQISGATELTGEQANTASAAHTAQNDAEEKKRRKQNSDALETQVLLNSIRTAQDIADAAAARAAEAEAGFEEEFGDAWREEIALRVLDPDENPVIREGESIEEYRERVEETLIDEMIDQETGEIKNEYKNDPEKLRYAQWAQDKFIERRAEAVIEQANEPDAKPEEIEIGLETLETLASKRQAAQAATNMNSPAKSQVDATLRTDTDDLREDAVSVADNSSDNGFSLKL